MKRLFEPASQQSALILASIILLLVPLLAVRTHAATGDFRIDEAHKLSESAFFPLWLRFDVRNPAWTANLTDRSNPPVGKYLFGLAIVLSGQHVPHLPTLSIYAGSGLVPPLFPPELSSPYAKFLPAGRWVAIVCTSFIAAIVTWCAARMAGLVGAIVAVALFLMHFLTRVYGATAIFDPILCLFATVLLAIAAAAVDVRSRIRFAALMTAAGIAGALAFQTRLNGLLFFAVTIVLLLAVSRPRSDKVMGLIAAAGAFVAVTLAVNPYYWPNPVARFALQVSDLHTLLLRCGGRLTTLSLKLDFAWQIIAGDLEGLLLLLAAAVGTVTLIVRWRKIAARDRVIGAWSVIVVAAFALWMPVPVQRYLLVTIPPLCCLAALGWRGAVALVEAAE